MNPRRGKEERLCVDRDGAGPLNKPLVTGFGPRSALTLIEANRIVRDDRLFSKVEECSDGCWQWIARQDSYGYGRVGWQGRNALAHRVFYELLRGEIPEGLTLDHACRNRACVNPAHMEAVELRENIMRGNGVGVRNARKTHCKYGHEFTPENTYFNQGKRKCRECGRRTTAAWHEKQRQKKRLA